MMTPTLASPKTEPTPTEPTPSLDDATCPDCGSRAINVQGLLDCPDCAF